MAADNMKRLPALLASTVLAAFCGTALAQTPTPFKPRGEINWRQGDGRGILLTEAWFPLAQTNDALFFGDLRLMGDTRDNREGNVGIGYRKLTPQGVVGVHGWMDRRETTRGSVFYQATTGAEWLGEKFDARANVYLPLTGSKYYPTGTVRTPYLAGTGLFINQLGVQVEEPQPGVDAEFGIPLLQGNKHIDSLRAYLGGYYFHGDETKSVAGWRTRMAADVTQDVQLGARYQFDAVRGSQGFLEATVRFPFSHKKSYRQEGLRARMDESPERDIDIVSADKTLDTGLRQTINTQTNTAQQIIHVDNTAATGGNGSAEHPFNTLLAAQNAAQAGAIIYVHAGSGTAGQSNGITLDKPYQQLIGAGVDFVWNGATFAIPGQTYTPVTTLIAPATTAPTITNIDGDGVRVTADDALITGIKVNGATGNGIVVEASGAGASVQRARIVSVTSVNNRMGLYIHGADGAAVSAMAQGVVTTGNAEHGMGVHDDTTGTFEVDLGGGAFQSAGRNTLTGNTLEDLAVDYGGRQLMANNNWWGQSGGPTTGNAATAEKAQIYYGAPLDNGLMGNWTFDTTWMNGTTIYDRSGNGNTGTANNGANITTGQLGNALHFDGSNDYAAINGAYPTGTNARTLTMWVNSDDTVFDLNADHIVAYGTAATLQAFGNMIHTGNQWAFYAHGADSYTGVPVTTGWQQHTITYDGTSIDYYINGSLVAHRVATLSTTANGLTFGRRPDGVAGNYYNGSVDDVRIYNRAFSASEAAELYRSTNTSTLSTTGALTSAP